MTLVHSYPKKLSEQPTFKFPWRNYQARIIDEFNRIKEDGHVHIIAPPGSGKTIIGLELMLRLNLPSLILCPTLAIRNQWKYRLINDFRSTEKLQDYISFDLEKPAFITITTYQNFYSKSKIGLIPQKQFQTLVLDEAHHLQNAWYKSIKDFKNKNEVNTISLTATPPYDSSGNEWNNYMDINGEIDIEISIPELVKESNLCPHQDYLYCSYPTNEEIKNLQNNYEKKQKCIQFLLDSEEILNLILAQDFILQPKEYLEEIYSNFEVYTYSLLYLQERGTEINPIHYEVLGYGEEDEIKFPTFTYYHLENLVNALVFSDTIYYQNNTKSVDKIRRKISRFGTVERKRLSLMHSKNELKNTLNSISKLNSIVKIVEFEEKIHSERNTLILTDYIREELFNPALKMDKIGIATIFRSLVEKNVSAQIAVLCGSFVIVPDSTAEKFKASSFKALDYYDGYKRLEINDKNKEYVQHKTTELFESDDIDVLIGTKSLLGEGWDAPFVNTLILASQIASYVSINQMRGRAIRTHKKNPNKIAHIWHLVSIHPYDEEGGEDLNLIKKRFKRFLGLSQYNVNEIRSGIKRIGTTFPTNKDEITLFNDFQCKHYEENESNLAKNWQKALVKGSSLSKKVKVNFNPIKDFSYEKQFRYKNSIRYFGISLVGLIGASFINLETFLQLILNVKHIGIAITLLIASISARFAIPSIKYLTLYLKYRDITKDIEGITNAIFNTLLELNFITTPKEKIQLVVEFEPNGEFKSGLEGATAYEQHLFIKSLSEVLTAPKNPRYLLERKAKLFKELQQTDYHAVPEIFGTHKKYAHTFTENWNKYVSTSELIYTRTLEGRKALLHARFHSLAHQLNEDKVDIIDVWK